MNHLIGYLIGFDFVFILPALIVLAFRKRMNLSTAKTLLIIFFVIMTAGTIMSTAPIAVQGIAVLIAAAAYWVIYCNIKKGVK